MTKIEDIKINLIDENPDNEKIFNMNDVDKLAQMIESQGFFGAIEVMEKGDGRYEILSGHRRFRAYKSLEKTSIPCIVSKTMNEYDKAKILISSNINNRRMEPVDYARAIEYYTKKVCEPLKLNKEEECMRFFGISRPQYYRYLRILGLSDRLLTYVKNPSFPYTALVDQSLKEEEQKKVEDLLDYEVKTYANNDIGSLSKNTVEIIVEKAKRPPKSKPKDVPLVEINKEFEIIDKTKPEYDPVKDDAETITNSINHITGQLEILDVLIDNAPKLDGSVKEAFKQLEKQVKELKKRF